MVDLWDCPNGNKFLDRVSTILEEQKTHLIISTPINLIYSLSNALVRYISKFQTDARIIFSDCTTPNDAISKVFNDAEDKNISDLLDDFCIPPFVVLKPNENASYETQIEWINFLSDLARLSKQRLDSNQPLYWCVAVILSSNFTLPTEDVCLDIISASSIFKNSDIEYAFEICLDEHRGSLEISPHDRLWLYSLCLGLCGTDPLMCNNIFSSRPTSLKDINQLLLDHPYSKLDRRIIEAVIMHEKNGHSSTKITKFSKLLKDEGLLSIDCYGNSIIHPAALKSSNLHNSIIRQIVQGQMRVYLPLVQITHKYICESLDNICGNNWHTYDQKFDSIKYEIGPLFKYMKTYLKGQFPSHLDRLAESWTNIRNIIAHGNLLDYETTKNAVQLFYQYFKP